MNQIENPNPADVEDDDDIPQDFIPMSAPVQRLKIPKKPGWHRHWIRGTADRIAQAQQAGYKFVNPEEVRVNSKAIGGTPEESGNTDLGNSRVSVVAGGVHESGQAIRLYLMECPQKFFEYSKKLLAQASADTAEAINAGILGAKEKGESKKEQSLRYVKTDKPDLFRVKN
jgi:hypothetical protein